MRPWPTLRRSLAVRSEFGSFSNYLWQFVNNQPLVNRWKTLKEVPAETAESNVMSRDLKKRGFRFVGPTICYAFMQAVGMVNDHLVDCFRHPGNLAASDQRREPSKGKRKEKGKGKVG